MTRKTLLALAAVLAVMFLFSSALAIDVDSVTLYGAKTLIAGNSAKLWAVINPQNATDQTLIWTSSDPKSASVNEKGVVTALDVSDYTTVTVTATAASGAFATRDIRVCPRAVSVEITPSGPITLDLSNEGYLQFAASVSPSTAEQEVVWSVSSKRVADITDGGLLSVKKKGFVTVRAKVLGQESVMASVRVEITRMASSLTIKGASKLAAGKKTKLACVIIPKMKSKNAVIWECLTPEIAKVSTSGKVTAFEVAEEQTAVIKATARSNPQAFATHEIVIVPASE